MTTPLAYFNSANPDKLREVQHALSGCRVGYLKVDVTESLDTDLERLVLEKAMRAYEQVRVPLIVEHGGLYVDYLKGLPGTLIKPFWNTFQLELGRVIPAGEPRSAQARSAVCFCDGRKRLVIGPVEVPGRIAPAPQGGGGFHWDPLFIPEGQSRTYAEMTLDEKLQHSPRGLALRELRQKLRL
jgi:XTP/dITP diphosphohydrolase